MEEFDIGVMDQAKSKGSGEILDHVDERVDEDFNQLVEGNAIDAGGGHSLGEGVNVSGEESDEVQALKAELERARVVEEKFKSIAIKV